MRFYRDCKGIIKKRAWLMLVEYLALRLFGVIAAIVTIAFWMPVALGLIIGRIGLWLWDNVLKPVTEIYVFPVTMAFKAYEGWENNLSKRFQDKHFEK